MVKEIALTQGKIALVDDVDYEYLMQWKWCYAYNGGRGSGYAATGWRDENGSLTIKYMHQLLAKRLGFNGIVDHMNHDGLDNRRYNLRECTNKQNLANRRKFQNCSSRYKGVCKLKTGRKKWKAQIVANYINKNLGCYHNEWIAAIAYNLAAIYHFGEFAALNTVEK